MILPWFVSVIIILQSVISLTSLVSPQMKHAKLESLKNESQLVFSGCEIERQLVWLRTATHIPQQWFGISLKSIRLDLFRWWIAAYMCSSWGHRPPLVCFSSSHWKGKWSTSGWLLFLKNVHLNYRHLSVFRLRNDVRTKFRVWFFTENDGNIGLCLGNWFAELGRWKFGSNIESRFNKQWCWENRCCFVENRCADYISYFKWFTDYAGSTAAKGNRISLQKSQSFRVCLLFNLILRKFLTECEFDNLFKELTKWWIYNPHEIPLMCLIMACCLEWMLKVRRAYTLATSKMPGRYSHQA